jgi:hypothetical protein
LTALLAGAPAAFAKVPTDPMIAPPPPTAPTVTYGSPVWLFVLVAAAAIVLTATTIFAARRLHRSAHTARAS